jgi:hypothetical protein
MSDNVAHSSGTVARSAPGVCVFCELAGTLLPWAPRRRSKRRRDWADRSGPRPSGPSASEVNSVARPTCRSDAFRSGLTGDEKSAISLRMQLLCRRGNAPSHPDRAASQLRTGVPEAPSGAAGVPSSLCTAASRVHRDRDPGRPRTTARRASTPRRRGRVLPAAVGMSSRIGPSALT